MTLWQAGARCKALLGAPVGGYLSCLSVALRLTNVPSAGKLEEIKWQRPSADRGILGINRRGQKKGERFEDTVFAGVFIKNEPNWFPETMSFSLLADLNPIWRFTKHKMAVFCIYFLILTKNQSIIPLKTIRLGNSFISNLKLFWMSNIIYFYFLIDNVQREFGRTFSWNHKKCLKTGKQSHNLDKEACANTRVLTINPVNLQA